MLVAPLAAVLVADALVVGRSLVGVARRAVFVRRQVAVALAAAVLGLVALALALVEFEEYPLAGGLQDLAFAVPRSQT